jgi:hypothetical protein
VLLPPACHRYPLSRATSSSLAGGPVFGVHYTSLLRFFYELRSLFTVFGSASEGELVRPFATGNITFNYPHTVVDPREIFTKQNDRALEIHLTLDATAFPQPSLSPVPSTFVITVPRGENTAKCRVQFTAHDQVTSSVFRVGKQVGAGDRRFLFDGENPVAELTPFCDACRLLADTLYIPAFRNAVNIGSAPGYFDIQIGQAFIGQWDSQKNGNLKSAAEATHQLEQDIARIFGFQTLQINAAPSKDTLQVFVNGHAYRLNELGAGLAQFIIVLANAAIKRPAYILIDEPELNLHPTLQMDFLTTLASCAQKGILFATHSYGLARASAEEIYTLERQADGTTHMHLFDRSPRLSQLLGELSYGGYAALGFEKILLVEGATEVKAIQQLLRHYGKDHQVLLLPLGGSNLINGTRDLELQEIKRITTCLFALVDSEKTAAEAPLPADRQDFKTLCEQLNIDCHVLERRALESYFTDEAMKRAGLQRHHPPGPYERMQDVNPGWSKSWNWQVTRQLSRDEIDATDLGRVLRNL